MFHAFYRDLNRANIGAALIALGKATGMSPTAARHAAKIVETCKEHATRCIKSGRYLLQKYCECCPTGQPVNWPKGPWIWKTDLAESLYASEFRELLETQFHINAKKVRLSELDRAGLSPDDLCALAFAIEDDLPAEDDGPIAGALMRGEPVVGMGTDQDWEPEGRDLVEEEP